MEDVFKGIVVGIILGIIFAVYCTDVAYKNGQTDALSGKIQYKQETFQEWVEIEK